MKAEVAAIQAEADQHGIPLLHVTQRAGVNYSTWCRWKRDDKPNAPSPTPIYLKAMQTALQELIAEKRRAA
jgi:hypothetical protein